jgi:hypothetical protein
MRRWTAAVIVMAMLGGCTTYQQSRTTAQVGGVAVLVGAVFVGVQIARCPPMAPCTDLSSGDKVFAGISLSGLLIGLTLLAGGGLGMLSFDRPAEPQAQHPAAPQASPRAAPYAPTELVRGITRSAIDSANANDCAAVKRREVDVLELDPRFHDTVFVRDAAIKKCLDAAVPAQPAPAERPAVSQ